MFNIVKKDSKCIIYRSGFIDAARCILKGTDADISVVAESEIKSMFSDMIDAFHAGSSVRMFFLKNEASDYVDFTSICDFKVWLIGMQQSDAYKLILEMLKEYCKKRKITLPKISIFLGDKEKRAIFNTDMYFNNTFNKEWFNNDMMKKIVKDIDKSDVINAEAINSPVFGIMPVEKLSGGVKTLMLIYNNPEIIFNASTCGDNCAKWIKKFSEEKDFVINLYHSMKFPGAKFEAYIVNGDKVITSMEELYSCVNEYCRS